MAPQHEDGRAQQVSHAGGPAHGQRQGQPRRNPDPQRTDRGDVGAETVKRGLSQRHLSGMAGQQRQTDDDEAEQADEDENAEANSPCDGIRQNREDHHSNRCRQPGTPRRDHSCAVSSLTINPPRSTESARHSSAATRTPNAIPSR